MTGADRGVSRRGGCRWLGFTFGLRTVVVGTSARGGRRRRGTTRGEEESERARERSPTVRYWRMISCLHSTDPVSNEGERDARDPFGIIEYHLPLCSFLSLFFLARRDGYKRIGYPVRARVLTNTRVRCAWRRRRRRWRNREEARETADRARRAHTFTSCNAVHLWAASEPLCFLPIGTVHPPHYAARTRIPRVHYATSSILVESEFLHHARRQRIVKEVPRFAYEGRIRASFAPWHIAQYTSCVCVCSGHNLSSIHRRNDVT